MNKMTDYEAIGYLNEFVKRMLNADVPNYKIYYLIQKQRELVKSTGKFDIHVPELRKLDARSEKILMQCENLAEETIRNGESILNGVTILNRNGGEVYRLTIKLEKVSDKEAKEKYPKLFEDIK